MMNEEIFRGRLIKFDAEATGFRRVFARVSWLRIIVTLIAISLFVYFANERMGFEMAATLVVYFISFGVVVKYHNKIKYKRDHHEHLKMVNENEIKRLKYEFTEFKDGAQYMDKSHPYSGDLDLFGRKSLFQLINRTTTPGGEKNLVDTLLNKTSVEEIEARQNAVRELMPLIDWRQNFEATGFHLHDEGEKLNTLRDWLDSEKNKKQNPYIPIVLGIIALSAITLWLMGILPLFSVVIALVINIFFLRTVSLKATEITGKSYRGLNALTVYKNLFECADIDEFKADNLRRIREGMYGGTRNASSAIQKLEGIIDFLHARSNSFFVIFNIVFLLDFYILNALIKWREVYGAESVKWFSLLSELETYSSLAGLAYSNPGFSFPKVTDTGFSIEAEDLGHPLINPHERVNNSFTLKGMGSTFVITGSNMSGKSTFLRTVGVNSVLAFAGAPVCAKTLSMSYFTVFTSMRINDDLSESISSFYAELKRLRQLLDHMEGTSLPTLFLLDEILRGTNSKDRHLGAVSLIKQLIHKNCFGLISTHDLALGDQAKDFNQIKNLSFNSKLKNDNLIFNYKLTEGVCDTFNASVLMKKMGIMNDY